jgi:hypothetical protein
MRMEISSTYASSNTLLSRGTFAMAKTQNESNMHIDLPWVVGMETRNGNSPHRNGHIGSTMVPWVALIRGHAVLSCLSITAPDNDWQNLGNRNLNSRSGEMMRAAQAVQVQWCINTRPRRALDYAPKASSVGRTMGPSKSCRHRSLCQRRAGLGALCSSPRRSVRMSEREKMAEVYEWNRVASFFVLLHSLRHTFELGGTRRRGVKKKHRSV